MTDSTPSGAKNQASAANCPVQFTAYGLPKPAGSKRAFQHRHTGRIVVTDAAKGSRAWKQEVASAARAAMTNAVVTDSGLLPDGPLGLHVEFFVPRPKGHYGARGLRPTAPDYPTTRPDVTKLVRAVEDALTGVVWRDDAQVVVQTVSKHYGEPARCEVAVIVL